MKLDPKRVNWYTVTACLIAGFLLGSAIGKAEASMELQYKPHQKTSYYVDHIRNNPPISIDRPSPTGQTLRFGNMVIPEGGRVTCIRGEEKPALVKQCADGSTTWSNRKTMCSNPLEIYDVQVSSTPPTESDIRGLSTGAGKFDRLQRCIIYLPPK